MLMRKLNKELFFNKYFLLVLCSFFFVFIFVTVWTFYYYRNKVSDINDRITYGRTMKIKFYTEIDVDANKIVKNFFGMNSESSSKRNDACWYWQIRSENGYQQLCKNLELPDEFQEIQLNFKENYYIISFGRKLEKMIYYNIENNDITSMDYFYAVYPDYNMTDEYEGKAYFYSMKKVTFRNMVTEDMVTSKFGNTGKEFYAKYLN